LYKWVESCCSIPISNTMTRYDQTTAEKYQHISMHG
jgi:hypothetical protein